MLDFKAVFVSLRNGQIEFLVRISEQNECLKLKQIPHLESLQNTYWLQHFCECF